VSGPFNAMEDAIEEISSLRADRRRLVQENAELDSRIAELLTERSNLWVTLDALATVASAMRTGIVQVPEGLTALDALTAKGEKS